MHFSIFSLPLVSVVLFHTFPQFLKRHQRKGFGDTRIESLTKRPGRFFLVERSLGIVRLFVAPAAVLLALCLVVSDECWKSCIVEEFAYEKWKDQDAGTVAACASALLAHGGSKSVAALKDGYWADPRKEVVKTLAGSRAFHPLEMPSILKDTQTTKRLSLPQSFRHLASSLEPLRDLTYIEDLQLSNGIFHDLSPLKALSSVKTVNLHRCNEISDLSPIRELTSLQTLDLSWSDNISDLSPLRGLIVLRDLDLSNCDNITDLAPLKGSTGLKKLDIKSCVNVSDFRPLSGLTALQTLFAANCEKLSDLSPLRGLTALESLDLSACERVSNLSSLSGLAALQILNLGWCRRVSDISALRGLSALRMLDLTHCHHVSDLSPLSGLTALEILDLKGCKEDIDMLPLTTLPRLQKIRLYRDSVKQIPESLQDKIESVD